MKHVLTTRVPVSCAMLVAARLLAGDWPQWHGPSRDCRIPDAEPLPASLPADLKAVWKTPVGNGFSSPVVAGGKLYIRNQNTLACYDVKAK